MGKDIEKDMKDITDKIQTIIAERLKLPPTFEDTNINDHIANLTMVDRVIELYHNTQVPTKRNAMYVFLREKYKAHTLKEAYDLLRQRRVDPGIVGIWVEEAYFLTKEEHEAIKEGYPEFDRTVLESMRSRGIKEYLPM